MEMYPSLAIILFENDSPPTLTLLEFQLRFLNLQVLRIHKSVFYHLGFLFLDTNQIHLNNILVNAR